MDEGWAVLIAAGFAILGIFYTSRQGRKALRKQHTYQVLDRLNGWQKFDDDMEFARRLIKAGEVTLLCTGCDTKAVERVDFLLNHYEFMAGAIISGDIDEALVRSVESDRITRLYLKLLDYVECNRAEFGTDRIWQNLEFITYRWTIERPEPYDTILDRFFLRPTSAHFDATRKSIRQALRDHAETLP